MFRRGRVGSGKVQHGSGDDGRRREDAETGTEGMLGEHYQSNESDET
jgi:hypothetical protein